MFAISNERRECDPFCRLEDVGIAEEIRDADQQVVKKRLDLLGLFFQKLQILFETLRPAHYHPAIQPPQNSWLLVLREIDAGMIARNRRRYDCAAAAAADAAWYRRPQARLPPSLSAASEWRWRPIPRQFGVGKERNPPRRRKWRSAAYYRTWRYRPGQK